MYKEGKIENIFENQLIKVFSQEKNPSYITDISIKSKDSEQGFYQDNSHLDKNKQYWGIYCKEKKFFHKGIDKLLKPQMTNFGVNILSKLKKNQVEAALSGLVKKDYKNIKIKCPAIESSTLSEYMIGDFNGDKQSDYVVIVDSSVVIVYTSKGKNFERTQLAFWENVDESWPRLFFSKDLNGDGNDEMCIVDCDGDTNIPTIYSWFKEKQGFMMVYQGKVEFWKG